MKQFFKPTAILASIALLFCVACADDGTEDVVSSSLGESEIRVIYPGNCQAWVKWVVPEDANISSCQLSWINSEGTSSGAATLAAQSGWMEAKLTDMPSGTYSFSLQSYTSSGVGSTVNSYDDVYVYDQNTYEDIYPTLTLSANSAGSYIDWSNVHEDCIGAYITYTDSDEKEVTTELTSLESQTIFTNAKSCSQVTYEVCYQPSFEYLGEVTTGLDIITVTCATKFAFPDAQPATPSEVVLSPGTNKFKIGWYTPQVIDITYVDVIIDGPGFSDQDTIRLSTSGVPTETSALGTSVVGTFTKETITELLIINANDYDAIGGSDEVVTKYHDSSNSKSSYSPFKNESNEVEAGEYTVTLYAVKGLTGTYSEPATYTVTVYDETETYTQHPAIDEIAYDGTDARIEWATSYESNGESVDVVDCIGVEVTYPTAASSGSENVTTALTPVEDAVDMPGIYYAYTESGGVTTPTTTFTYESYFCPENGLDILSIVNTDATNIVPLRSPTKPSNVQIYPSDNSIYVYCDLANDEFIDGLRFTYYSADGSEILATEDLAIKNLNLGEENEFSLSGTVAVGITYVVGIQSYNDEYDNVSAMQLFENIEIYDYASFVATCAAPTVESYDFDNTTCQYSFVWDAPVSGAVIEFTYVCTAEGDTKTVYLTEYDGDMIFTDLMPGSTYTYITRFSPVENAMDVLEYNPVEATLTDEYVYKTWTEYESQAMAGSIACNNVDANNVTNTQWAFADLWNENYQKTAASGTANYEFGAASPGTEGWVETLAFGQTINIDLGNVYKLSRFAIHMFISAGWGTSAVKDFALYGTSYEDPVNNSNYNAYNSDGVTPNLTYWDLLIEDTVLQPSVNNIDWNGDGVANTTDDDDIMWGGLDADGYADGSALCFDIIDAVPIRYFKIQINSVYGTTATAPTVRIQEIDLWQAGFVSDEWID